MEFSFTPKDTNPIYIDSILLTPGTVTLPDNYSDYAALVAMLNEGILKPLNSLEEGKAVAKKTRAKKVVVDAE